MVIVVFGVSGCGKSTIAAMLSQALHLPYYDADDYHPEANIVKMARGEPLNDRDRASWLKLLSEHMHQWEKAGGAVLACSALKESYRRVLASRSNEVYWVLLSGSYELISERIRKREGHFMPPELLRSQFETLEVPGYGLHLDIKDPPEDLIHLIKSYVMSRNKSVFGVFGLGVMGKSISLNLSDKGIAVSVYNRREAGEENVVSEFLKEHATRKKLLGFTDIEAFVNSLERPRKILLMISAGPVVDLVLEALVPLLSEGDIVMDGGNSHFKDTERRQHSLKIKGIDLLGVGISGGEEGARKGPSIMPGGARKSYDLVSPVLEAVAARDKQSRPCCTYIGPGGSGHFIKMVHNGIEYVEMQLLAESFAVLKGQMSYEDIADEFENWNRGGLSGYLLEITIDILKRRENGSYLLDHILDKAGNKGTGSWSSKAALDLGMPSTMMSSAVFARYISSFKEERVDLAAQVEPQKPPAPPIDLKTLKEAYEFARLVNHHQGFELMRMASETHCWNLNLSEISGIWTNGCIIKSELMESLKDVFMTSKSLFDASDIRNRLVERERSVANLISLSLDRRLALHAFGAAFNYWVDMTTQNLPANLIQAQRDYFGAHTYERKDAPEGRSFHTDWRKKPG